MNQSLTRRLQLAALALALTGGVATSAFAQSSQDPITRTQVKSDLTQMEQAGYYPNSGQDPTYPKKAQAAERRVSADEGPRYRVAQTGDQMQDQTPVTAASRKDEIIRLEAAGYRPGDEDKTKYPEDLQKAEKKAGMD